jgi:uncharacterized BrkB/YihY/UPF0761 family membrane protein
MGTRLTRRTAAARLVGVLAAVTTLIVLWFASGLYTSGAGLVIAGVISFGIGTSAATLIDPQWERNATVVVLVLLVLAACYLLVLPRLLLPDDRPGSRGGPAVERRGA